MSKQKAGIYIHIPFCTIKCIYCDFYSLENRQDSIPIFFKSILKEIDQFEVGNNNIDIDTIFIGGGTPSLISPDLIEKLLIKLSDHYNLEDVEEITIEANPGEAPSDNLKAFYDLGINRISIGVQSLQKEILKFLSRNHSSEDVFNTIKNAKKAGFNNINCDLIFNIPGQQKSMWKDDLNSIIELDIKHISCYSLIVEKNTKLFQLVNKKTVMMPNDDKSAEIYKWTQDQLKDKNFIQYEVSNWAKSDSECIHNMHYWKIEPYFAFGPSAHGFDGKKRYWNVRSLDGYIKSIENNKSPIESSELLSKKDIVNELIGFGIRTRKGVELNKIPNSFKQSVYNSIKSNHKKWGKYFILNKDNLKLSKRGFCFADAIAIDLLI
ncbi:MAG: coproporphyrinogen III oxidase [Candidatus Marinimicrobia bacterium]|nr:coproporphyrinogen III oxidase [Candidatus Neomarinimicrobiota bacterium]